MRGLAFSEGRFPAPAGERHRWPLLGFWGFLGLTAVAFGLGVDLGVGASAARVCLTTATPPSRISAPMPAQLSSVLGSSPRHLSVAKTYSPGAPATVAPSPRLSEKAQSQPDDAEVDDNEDMEFAYAEL